jgi:hypothetical protein
MIVGRQLIAREADFTNYIRVSCAPLITAHQKVPGENRR